MELEGASAVVTGAGSGIGRAVCLLLCRAGARVIAADIDLDAAARTADLAARAGGIAIARQSDVTRTEDIAGALAAAVEHFGRLDIVHNNAGMAAASLFDDDSADWRRMIDLNLTAVIDGTRIAVREMRRSGGGVIVNTASMGGLLPMPDAPVYAATKAGVINFTRSLAYLAASDRIRVNAICPSYVDTPLLHGFADAARQEEMRRDVGGILDVDSVAAGVLELIEDDSRAGAVMRVTIRGGRDYRW